MSKITLVLLALFLGGLGLHKFYVGKHWQGILYILFCWTGLPGIVALIEAIIYICTSSERLNEKYSASGTPLVIAIISIIIGFAIIGILAAIAIPQFVKYREQAQKHSIQQQEEKKVTATMCSNVYDDYLTGKVTDEELLFVYKSKSIAFKKSNGTYLHTRDKEMCIYLEFQNLERGKEYTVQYTIYDPENKLYSLEDYIFTPKSVIWHSWNTKRLVPEGRKRLVEGSWRIQVTLDDKPVAEKLFDIRSGT